MREKKIKTGNIRRTVNTRAFTFMQNLLSHSAVEFRNNFSKLFVDSRRISRLAVGWQLFIAWGARIFIGIVVIKWRFMRIRRLLWRRICARSASRFEEFALARGRNEIRKS